MAGSWRIFEVKRSTAEVRFGEWGGKVERMWWVSSVRVRESGREGVQRDWPRREARCEDAEFIMEA